MPQMNNVPSSTGKRPKQRRPRNGTPVPAAADIAGFDFAAYNRQFMQRTSSAPINDAAAYGACVEARQLEPGQIYWRVIGVHHLMPDENRDRHNAFVEVLDEGGSRVKDANLRVGWTWEGKADGPADSKRLDKPDNEPAADIPIEKNMTASLWLEGAGPSERVVGVHTRHEDEVGPGGGRNSRFHHSYYIVFQRTQAAASGKVTSNSGTASGTGTEADKNAGNGTITTQPAAQPFRFLRWPTDHLQVIQPFGVNPEIYNKFGFPGHEGVDIVAAEDEPVYCVAPGMVTMVNTPDAYAVNQHPYGVHVRVQHQDGYETIYAHFKELRVSASQSVEAGQVLGLADHTGNVFGDPPDHLHLTLKHAGETVPGYRNNIVDPMPFLLPLLQPGPAGPGTVQVRVSQKLGLNCNAPIGAGGNITPRLADPRLIGETGVGWVRLNFILRGFAGPDEPRWVDTYRRIIDGLRSQGLQIYALIGAEAVLEDPGNQFRDPPPAGPVENAWIRSYASNFRRILELFGDAIAVVESFNEPNDWHRTPGDPTAWEKGWIDPGWFAIMLQTLRDAVVDMRVTLVSGPLLSTQFGNDAAAYLPRVYQAGSERFGWGQPSIPVPFDGVGFHPYVAPNPGDPQVEIPAGYRQYVAELCDAIARFEPAGKPIFLSEIGWQNAEDRQALCMEVGLTCALDDPAVALCFWYGMQDDAGESYGLYRRTGLTHEDRKPVFDRFLNLANSQRTVPAAYSLIKRPAALFIAELDSTPDDSVLAPGSSFAKVWRMRNTGATTWGEGYQFCLVGGPALDAPAAIAVPACAPGQTADINVSFVAPTFAGEYTSIWSLADPQGKPFGDRVWTRIVVTAPAAVGLPAASMPPHMEAWAGTSPLVAAALGMIYQTYWLRVWSAASDPDAQKAIQAAGDDALSRIRELMKTDS